LIETPFAFCHIVESNSDQNCFTFGGHVHPATRIPGFAGDNAKIPCFALSDHSAILPAFGEFTGTAIVSRKDFPRLYAVADDQVIELASLENATDDR
jgi:metallophosphoesterase superfamily enzyme